ncbi:hypothetical protein K438DRAFT_1934690 [Mycena galopus ATCC 62051]|nr:hypothetical protein K438DRAFT_1934690 [Mycena galopus ATCC 62051]
MTVFLDLDEDIVLTVLSICDVSTVLSASRQINKLIRVLALSKPVWVALVADLITRCIMDASSDPNFATYSAPQLRDTVKRLVRGPAWRNGEFGPAVHQRVSVESSDIVSNKRGSSWPSHVKLLPGGRFFTLEHDDGRIECWSLTKGVCVWKYSQKRRTGYVVDVLDGGNTARFLLPGSSQELFYYPYSIFSSFSIVQVELTTGVSFEIFRMPRKDEIRWWSDADALLNGDLVALTVHIHGNWVVLLINWKEETYINFHQTMTVPGIALVPGHIVLATATPDPPFRPVLLICTHKSLAPHWQPLADWRFALTHTFNLHCMQEGSGIMPTFVEHLGAQEGWQVAPEGLRPLSPGMRLTLRESPLQQHTYALTLVVYDRGPLPSWGTAAINGSGCCPDPRAILVTYRVSAYQDSIRLVHISAAATVRSCKARDVSYVRYAVGREGVEDVDLDRRGAPGKGELKVGPLVYESIHLSPTSGAVTTLAASTWECIEKRDTHGIFDYGTNRSIVGEEGKSHPSCSTSPTEALNGINYRCFCGGVACGKDSPVWSLELSSRRVFRHGNIQWLTRKFTRAARKSGMGNRDFHLQRQAGSSTRRVKSLLGGLNVRVQELGIDSGGLRGLENCARSASFIQLVILQLVIFPPLSALALGTRELCIARENLKSFTMLAGASCVFG